ncbi:uncharacterized protein E0L32_006115 [Thyridium curvatum]|uniref:Uncharacterized protein n=1 Tax=Thyridium curvatum TaxID=1093900 RepID=A0A507ARD4_9PEZI|nr:uncharacterized protein E0L32_006115 [Thyridium curvatum]TPX13385.1 hypothetical protein E0L32_006115 [Thyridium curvatum]
MSWGHIESDDLVVWKPAEISPALLPDEPYDQEGVFTGCWIPNVNESDETIRIAYSSVKQLPFHWSTPPYPRNAAGISVASSSDGGVTWKKSPRNPILLGEPAGVQVTGFRDPYVMQSSELDRILGADTKGLYGLVSGGVEGSGPTTWLYTISPDDLESWAYVCPLVDILARHQPFEPWGGNYGVNWECTNLLSLSFGKITRQFLILGAEGDVEKAHVKHFIGSPESPSRTVRAQLWMSGPLSATKNGPRLQYKHGGYLDHGPFYAANSLLDLTNERHIVHGWIPEEDITLNHAKRKGWNGSMALPREIFLLYIPMVVGALRTKLGDITSFEIYEELDGSCSVLTLGVKPIAEMAELRGSCGWTCTLGSPLNMNRKDKNLFDLRSTSWELEMVVSLHESCETLGFHIYLGENRSCRTTVTFSVVEEMLIVDRHESNGDITINKCPDAGPFTLLWMKQSDTRDALVLEALRLRIFSDGDILEVFANDRFALTTMVYAEHQDSTAGTICAFATGRGEYGATLESARLWDGLGWDKHVQG